MPLMLFVLLLEIMPSTSSGFLTVRKKPFRFVVFDEVLRFENGEPAVRPLEKIRTNVMARDCNVGAAANPSEAAPPVANRVSPLAAKVLICWTRFAKLAKFALARSPTIAQ